MQVAGLNMRLGALEHILPPMPPEDRGADEAAKGPEAVSAPSNAQSASRIDVSTNLVQPASLQMPMPNPQVIPTSKSHRPLRCRPASSAL